MQCCFLFCWSTLFKHIVLTMSASLSIKLNQITVKSAKGVRRFMTITPTSVNGNPSLTRYISYYWAMCRDRERESSVLRMFHKLLRQLYSRNMLYPGEELSEPLKNISSPHCVEQHEEEEEGSFRYMEFLYIVSTCQRAV